MINTLLFNLTSEFDKANNDLLATPMPVRL